MGGQSDSTVLNAAKVREFYLTDSHDEVPKSLRHADLRLLWDREFPFLYACYERTASRVSSVLIALGLSGRHDVVGSKRSPINGRRASATGQDIHAHAFVVCPSRRLLVLLKGDWIFCVQRTFPS